MKTGQKNSEPTMSKEQSEVKKRRVSYQVLLKSHEEVLTLRAQLKHEQEKQKVAVGHIPRNYIYHHAVMFLTMLNKMPVGRLPAVFRLKAESLAMLMFFYFSEDDFVVKKNWDAYVKKYHLPVRYQFDRIVKLLEGAGLVKRLAYTKPGVKNVVETFSLLHEGRKLAEDMNFLRQHVLQIGIKPLGDDGE